MTQKYKIKISGLNLHHALDYFLREHFSLEDVIREDPKTVILTLSKADFKKFKKENFSKTYKIEVLEKYGFEKVQNVFLRRLGLLFGFVLAAVLIMTTTNRIYSVELNDANHTCQNKHECIFYGENRKEFLNALANYGIKAGVKANKSLNYREIERNLIKDFKQVSGVKISVNGSKIKVEVVEATLKEEETTLDIIAPFSGIIVSSEVVSGKAMVKNGDIVLKDQVLVKSVDQKRANATFLIRSFIHENTLYSENQITYTKTGKVENKTTIELFGLKLGAKSDKDFTYYQSDTATRYAFYNLFLPVIVKTEKITEMKRTEQFISFESQEQILKRELYELTKSKLPESAEEKNVTYATYRDGDKVRLDCYIEVLITVRV